MFFVYVADARFFGNSTFRISFATFPVQFVVNITEYFELSFIQNKTVCIFLIICFIWYLFYQFLIDNRVNRLAGILPVIIRSKNQRDANFLKTEQNSILSIFKTDATLKYLTNFYTCNILCLVQLPKKPQKTMKHLWEF